MTAYYNEFDPKAAAWLRELIKQGHISDGVVDERSIEDVTPTELAGFTQCHFFAGIGVWSYALRRAGWADNRPVWTGSCPCQPFSAAGKGAGFVDERHLWPAFHHLISQCRPDVVLGEQVASKDGLAWLDLVQSDLEATGYASGAVDLCAAGIGAPHIRQRLWWVGKRLGNTDNARPQGHGQSGNINAPTGWQAAGRHGAEASVDVGLADTVCDEKYEKQLRPTKDERKRSTDEFGGCSLVDASTATGSTNGHWRDADWLFCRDGKWRPVEPGTSPLVNGAAARMVQGSDNGKPINAEKSAEARVMRLRGYGNAIIPSVAAAFIGALLDATHS